METLIVKVKDDRKLSFVLELLRDLDYLEVSQESGSAETERPPLSDAEIAAMSPAEKAQAFLGLAGIWKDRDIDARELRERAWRRGNSGS